MNKTLIGFWIGIAALAMLFLDVYPAFGQC